MFGNGVVLVILKPHQPLSLCSMMTIGTEVELTNGIGLGNRPSTLVASTRFERGLTPILLGEVDPMSTYLGYMFLCIVVLILIELAIHMEKRK